MSGRKLPKLAAVDASFVANVHAKADESLKALLALREVGTVFRIPTPVWAEIGRGPGGEPRLAAFGFAPAPLNHGAAQLLFRHLAKKVKKNPCGRFVWDCDAQIYACALIAGCDAIITDNVADFASLKNAASPRFPRDLELWSSAQLAKHAPSVQLPLTPR